MKSCGAALYLFTRLNNAFTTPLILPDDVLHEKSVRSLLVRFQFLVFLKKHRVITSYKQLNLFHS